MVDFTALAAPFSPASVSWRIGSTTADKSRGMALAYLDARDVMDRLDEVCGVNWQCRYSHVGPITVCEIGILVVAGDWLWRADGAGQSDIEAEKGALSDAFKRSAVRWGIGRYLYSLPSPWVEIETRGRSSIIKQHEYARLADILQKHSPAAPPARPTLPDAVDDADKALLKNGDDQRSTYEVNKRKAAENFASAALAAFEGLNGATINEWYREAISPKGKSTNRDALDRMREAFPDLADKVDAAAEEVRLRGGARLQ